MSGWLVKLIIIGVAVSVLTGALAFYGHTRYKAGYAAAMKDVSAAVVKADEKTRGKQADIQKNSNEVIDEIKKNRSDDRPVSRPIRDQLVRMRARD